MTRPRAGLKLVERAPQVEAALWRRLRFEQDRHSRETLFDRYAALARNIAKRELRRRPAHGLERTDFEQLAFSGLLEAIDRFDPLRGTPFEAFARPRIKGAIADGAVRSSEAAAQFSARRRIEQERVTALLRRDSLGEEALSELAELATALAIGLIAENAGLNGAPQHTALDVYENLAWRDMGVRVLDEIAALPDAERTVMQNHYINNVPFTQIAQLMRLSKGRIAQLHRAALMRLRTRIGRET